MLDVVDLRMLGGHVALDFVNTVEDRASRNPDDTLRSSADLHRWGVRADVLSRYPSVQPREGETGELGRALAFREDLHDVIHATVRGAPARGASVRMLADTVAGAYAAGTLRRDEAALTWTWSRRTLSTVRFTVAAAAVALLTDSESVSRIRRCDGAGCGWFFLDTSKNASRRWCSMRGCGTLAKSHRRAESRGARGRASS